MAAQTPQRKNKPPKAKPRTVCELCGRVGRAETFIRSDYTGKHYCVDTLRCDKRRGVNNSRKAPANAAGTDAPPKAPSAKALSLLPASVPGTVAE